MIIYRFSVYCVTRKYRSFVMSENSTVISPTMLGVSSGVAGMGLGYVIAPRKYPIERLLTRSDDTFEKTFSPGSYG